jgi:hypothetical protein
LKNRGVERNKKALGALILGVSNDYNYHGPQYTAITRGRWLNAFENTFVCPLFATLTVDVLRTSLALALAG